MSDPNSEKDIMHIKSGLFVPQLKQIMSDLPGLKMERPHGPKAVQSQHDLTALTSKPRFIRRGSSWRLAVHWQLSIDLAGGWAFGCPCGGYLPIHHSDPVSLPLLSRKKRTKLTPRPEIFELRDMNDNTDLQRTSGRLLAMITSITPSLDLIEPLMEGLISILQNASVSQLSETRIGLCSGWIKLTMIVLEDQDALYARIEFGILQELVAFVGIL
jgi:proteasome activator subunit 4